MSASVDPNKQQEQSLAEVERLFEYQKPLENQVPRYGLIRGAAKNLAFAIVTNTPAGADRSAALRKVREAVMTANAAIALELLPPAPETKL